MIRAFLKAFVLPRLIAYAVGRMTRGRPEPVSSRRRRA